MFADTDLSADELFNDPRFRIIESVDDSKAINNIRGGAVIMSASGMADAGRIQHHLCNNLQRANATVLFVGYQAPGTLGQIILSGAREVRIHGELIPVRAQVKSLGTYSAHADHSELMAWVKARLPAHGALFLTHGEDEERAALRAALVADGTFSGDQIIMPLLDDAVDLLATGVAGVRSPAARRTDLKQLSSDWNNSYQALLVDLEEGLRKAPSDEARLALMQQVRAAVTPTGVLTGPPPSKGIGTDVAQRVNPITSGGEPGGE
jgi:metallo-beta-lactamase family protein